jgi:serine/threonine protein kinase
MTIPEVIGEGGFGCVFKPSLPCANKKISYKNKISKWMLSKNAIEELQEYAIIAKADPSADFYTGKPTKCTLKRTPLIEKAIERCDLLKNKMKNKTAKEIEQETALLIITDGGDDLEKWVKKVSRLDSSVARSQIADFWKESRRLFLGIQTFLKNNLVHHDLKPQNIVYKSDTKRVNYIDFGLMRSTKTEMVKCSVKNACRSKSHWNYPTDILLMNRKVYENLAKKSVAERSSIVRGYLTALKNKTATDFVKAFYEVFTYIIRSVDGDMRADFYKRYWKGFEDLLMAVRVENYTEFLNKSLRTFDVHGLGLSFLFVLNRVKKFMDAKVVAQLYELSFNMMTPNVFARYTVERALLEYDKIFDRVS